MARQSSLYRMANTTLNGRLRQIVMKARKADVSWAEIAADLRTQGVIVSHETLRSWFREDEPDEANGDRVAS